MGETVTAIAILQRRWGDSWLLGADAEQFWPQLAEFQTQWQTHPPQDILLAEPDPVRFLAAFCAACQHPTRLWLANPHWGTQEWAQVAAQGQPDVVIGETGIGNRESGIGNRESGIGNRESGVRRNQEESGARSQKSEVQPHPPVPHLPISPSPQPLPRLQSKIQNPKSKILIPTGGSSGHIRFAVHTWDTLAASVWGFQQHFQVERVNAYCVLPLFHVSGLLQGMRCLLTGGTLALQPFRDLLQAGPIAHLPAPAFLSLVPTQLQRLLQGDRDCRPWLRQFTAILLGGAPPWPDLLQRARSLHLPLAPTYGMTETASQVATLLPQEFLAGHTGSGRPLPHARITILDEGGNSLPPGQTGRIAIAAASLALARGQTPLQPPLQTGDLGYLDEAGFLHVIGRETTLIITGGEKVLPEEVEAAILATGWVQDVAVLGVADADWGEKVVAVIAGGTDLPEFPLDRLCQQLHQVLKSRLSAYKVPKQWFIRSDLPRNAQGKVNRGELRQWVMAQVATTAVTTESTPPSGDGAGE